MSPDAKDESNNNNNKNNITDQQKVNDKLENSSPVSEKSQHISIISLDDDDLDDLTDSDSDSEVFGVKTKPALDNTLNELSKNNPDCSNSNLVVLSQNLNDEAVAARKPNIGSIALNNSTDVTFGDKTFYHGPVVIQKFIYEKNRWKENNNEATGQENPSNVEADGKVINNSGTNDKKPSLDPVSPIKLYIKNHRLFLLLTICGFFIILLLIGLIVGLNAAAENDNPFIPGDGDDSRKNIPIDSNIVNSLPKGLSKLRLVSRDEWLAQPPNNPLDNLTMPIDRVIIAHTATEGCETQAQCTFRVRFIQTFHMESQNWDDIGYNFLVGGDGAAYEARGWKKVGAHTKGYNYGSICIAFIGTFTRKDPVQRQLDAAKLLLEEGVRLKHLTSDYKLMPHRAFFGTESPGDNLYNILKTWPHFSETI